MAITIQWMVSMTESMVVEVQAPCKLLGTAFVGGMRDLRPVVYL